MNMRAYLCVVGVRAHVRVHARGVAWRACAYAQVKALRAREKIRGEAAKTAKMEEERNRRSNKGRKFPPPFVLMPVWRVPNGSGNGIVCIREAHLHKHARTRYFGGRVI